MLILIRQCKRNYNLNNKSSHLCMSNPQVTGGDTREQNVSESILRQSHVGGDGWWGALSSDWNSYIKDTNLKEVSNHLEVDNYLFILPVTRSDVQVLQEPSVWMVITKTFHRIASPKKVYSSHNWVFWGVEGATVDVLFSLLIFYRLYFRKFTKWTTN